MDMKIVEKAVVDEVERVSESALGSMVVCKVKGRRVDEVKRKGRAGVGMDSEGGLGEMDGGATSTGMEQVSRSEGMQEQAKERGLAFG